MRPLLLILLLLAGCAQVEAPKKSGYTTLYGMSMGRTVDYAAVIPIPYEDLRVGLWVRRAAWDAEGRVSGYVGHRIIARDGPLWILKGDNNLTNSQPDLIRLTPSNYAGVLADPVTKEPL